MMVAEFPMGSGVELEQTSARDNRVKLATASGDCPNRECTDRSPAPRGGQKQGPWSALGNSKGPMSKSAVNAVHNEPW